MQKKKFYLKNTYFCYIITRIHSVHICIGLHTKSSSVISDYDKTLNTNKSLIQTNYADINIFKNNFMALKNKTNKNININNLISKNIPYGTYFLKSLERSKKNSIVAILVILKNIFS